MPAVNPQVLVWARESAGLDLGAAARKLSVKGSKSATAEENLREYEEGGRQPSRSLILRMSKQYRRPLLTFYLSEPPRAGDRGEDFRTLAHDIDPAQNAMVDALVRGVRARQEIVKDALLSAQEGDQIAFVASYPMEGGVERLVALIKQEIGFDPGHYRDARTQEDAFRYLRACVESAGVFTLLLGNLGSHHSNIGVDEFRGFALADQVAPFIVINDQDAKAAWSMTLLHELAHLWLGETGVSGRSIERQVERFCNEVASEILLPESELVESISFSALAEWEATIQEIDDAASRFMVSSRLVAFRLLQRDAIDGGTYSRLATYFQNRYETFRSEEKSRARKSDNGPSYYVVRRHRLGSALLNASERLLRSGELSTTRAATVLGVRALNVEKVLQARRPV